MEMPVLLGYLKNSPGKFLSGEAIASLLGVSRAAVWKEIEALRRLGYQVEAAPRKGYRLLNRPDRLYPWEIASGLKNIRLGRSIFYYDRIDSTNNQAKRLPPVQAQEGALIVAEEQSAGRGRLGREWSSAKGAGIWMSLLLQPQLPVAELPKLTIMTAAAVRRAVQDETGLSPLIKWPNDLVLDGRKICGILAEISGEIDSLSLVILGIGINVNQQTGDFPLQLRESAGSLRLAKGEPVDRLKLLLAVLHRLEEAYLRVCAEGFSEVLKDCRSFSATIGRTVTVRAGTQNLTGYAETIGEDGGLKLLLPSGETATVYAGETI